jgi:hypothetical protein
MSKRDPFEALQSHYTAQADAVPHGSLSDLRDQLRQGRAGNRLLAYASIASFFLAVLFLMLMAAMPAQDGREDAPSYFRGQITSSGVVPKRQHQTEATTWRA